MRFRACLTILVLCPGVGCSAAGTRDDPLQVVDDAGKDAPAASPRESAGTLPSVEASLDAPSAQSSARGDDSCVAIATSQAQLSEPIDLILVLDNSASMADELRAVELSLNGGFGTILAESSVDYRVILISEHRSRESQDTAVCIQGPLSPVASCPSPEPGSGTRFFHYSTEVESEDSLEVLLESFSGAREDQFGLAPLGWSEWLRPAAKKAFIVLTDDDADMPAMEFAAALTELAPEQFGQDPSRFAFTWHSIVGVVEQSLPTQPYLPDAPIEAGECEGSASNAGETYQELSRLTGGLRFPSCQPDAYDAVFQQVAQAVLPSQSSCGFALPTPPPGRILELETAALAPRAGSAAPIVIGRVENAAACRADAFFVAGSDVRLCPQACDAVTANDDSERQLLFTCRSSLL